MIDYVNRSGLNVALPLVEFIERRVLPDVGLRQEFFWAKLANLFACFADENAALLRVREELQAAIDAWHDARGRQPIEQVEYESFLRQIGYLLDEPTSFEIETKGLDPEVSRLAGPQLVVPALNTRFVLNAANARWGSLYDALYGTDAIAGRPSSLDYDPVRGSEVVARAKAFLDEVVPLSGLSWSDWTGGPLPLVNPSQLVGRRAESLLLCHNGLHIEIIVNREHPVGRGDPAGIADIVLEAALTTIVDLEDSVAAVDAEDKVAGYSNWLGLMRGDLVETFDKGGRQVRRELAPDRIWEAVNGSQLTLPGRSLLLVRNVGHLMSTPAVLLPDGTEAPEGILDGAVTALIALLNLKGQGRYCNSPAGSIYIVKPKMHGPDECAFADRLFDAIEDMLGIPRHTLKIGVMDEERRTSANLARCIAEVRGRMAFINTGFLDRTGDEIHTSMRAGPMVRKHKMRSTPWIEAYEARNVVIGLQCGLGQRAQIGKGMWAAPDRMADMVDQKIVHPLAGASTAWVPSPTAATLHAMHYHQVNVANQQLRIGKMEIPPLSQLLTIPLLGSEPLTPQEISQELDNNAQGILGYVVRWIDQGVGCSKVPDINDIGLMEDRATLRISSQHIANWLFHGICTAQDVEASLHRMIEKVNRQNEADPSYTPMGPTRGFAVAAARALIFQGSTQPNGYTEPLLHCFRKQVKAQAADSLRRPADLARSA